MLDKTPGLWYYNIRKREGKPTKPERKKKMMTYEVENLYDDYCWECEQNGIEPKPIEQWWKELV